MCDYQLQNELTALERILHARLNAVCEKLNPRFSLSVGTDLDVKMKLLTPPDEAVKNDWAQRIVRRGFGLEHNLVDVRKMNDEEIAEMIPMYRGAVKVVESLLQQIDADQK